MSKSQALRKYLTQEDLLQERILTVIARDYPEAKVIHVPNEGKRSDFEQLKFKVLGGMGGIADLLVSFKPKTRLDDRGLWVEVKYGRNKLAPDQLAFLVQMWYFGYAVAVVYDKEEDFSLLLDRYLSDPVAFRAGIALAKDAELRFVDFAEAEKKLTHKVSAARQKRDIKESFAKKAMAKFGAALPKSKLPNAGKLFQSPRDRSK